MIIGELLVKLGIKGDEKAKQSLEAVRGKISDTGSSALAMKASILGAMWGLERMMSASNNAGAGLMNFAASTGMSIGKLQEWKYAAQQVNVAGEEVEGSMKGLQGTMASMLQGKGAPEGMAMLADFMAKSGEAFDPARARDMDYMLKNIQKFAQSGPADILKDKVQSFGISEGVFAAMRQNAFRPEVMAKAPKYSEAQAEQLAKTNAAWANLGQKIEMTFGKFNSKHGQQLVKDISKITDSVLGLANAFMAVAEKYKIFDKISEAVKGLAMIADIMSGKNTTFDSSWGGLADIVKGFAIESAEGVEKNRLEALARRDARVAPALSVVPKTTTGGTQNVTVNNNMTYQHDGKNSKRNASDVSKATKDAIRTLPRVVK